MAKQQAIEGTLIVGGVEYVVIPRAEYLRLKDRAAPTGGVEARPFVRDSLAAGLRAAREQAGLTQAELATRLGKSQTMVSQAESGAARISERFVKAVLKACGLPEDWNGEPARRTGRKRK
jgi:ribosome-binding protein aMBF1 (putative translation factor)